MVNGSEVDEDDRSCASCTIKEDATSVEKQTNQEKPAWRSDSVHDVALGLTLHALPQELQQHIISFLDPADVLRRYNAHEHEIDEFLIVHVMACRASLVSQNWRRLAEDEAMWRRFHDRDLGGPPIASKMTV